MGMDLALLTATTPVAAGAALPRPGPSAPGELAAASASAFEFAVVLVAVPAGVAAGAATRRWLARLRRGADVPPSWCEVGVALLWAAAVLAWAGAAAPLATLPLLLGLGWLGVAGSAVDLLRRRLPDAVTLPALPLVLLLLLPMGPGAVARGAVAAVLFALAHAVVHLLAPAAMGAGDVKLALPVGAALGGMSWTALPLGAALAVALTGLLAVAVSSAGHLRGLGRLPERGGRPSIRCPAPVTTDRAPPPAAPSASAPRSIPSSASMPPSTAPPAGCGLRRSRAIPHGPSMLTACWVTVLLVAVGGAG